ncbi:MAG: hypothetical protein O7A62_11445 [Alphaproteobacteria bacterium]|nr:hypothetical protein [Alphaproteobacteria bacterium]
MALPIDHSVPDTAPGAATNVFGAAGAELVVSEAGANPAGAVPAGIVVAAAGDGLKADLTVLGLADLLRLRLNEDGPTGRQGVQAEDGAAGRPSGLTIGLTQLRGIADVPADLTDLDLEQVLGLDLTGNILPTVLEVAKLPADLTGLELAQVLGLKLAGAAVPTIQEVGGSSPSGSANIFKGLVGEPSMSFSKG